MEDHQGQPHRIALNSRKNFTTRGKKCVVHGGDFFEGCKVEIGPVSEADRSCDVTGSGCDE